MTFDGFRPQLIEFLTELAANNTRAWFQAHRLDYENCLLEPAREFVLAMGQCLPRLGADIHAEPRIHGSILAINRDIRFSTDKTPYKTWLDLWFWQGGNGPSRERPGYFCRLTPDRMVLGAGMHGFSPAALARYRQAVIDDPSGSRLAAAAAVVQQNGFTLGGQTYKRVPAGLPPEHPRADWLRHSSLFAALEQPLPAHTFSAQLPELCFEHYARLAPLQQWLVDLLPA